MMLLDVEKEKCNQDAICVSECPTLIIKMDSSGDGYPAAEADFENLCLRCGHCVAVCPKGAIRLQWLAPEQCQPIKKELMITPDEAEQLLRGRRSIRTFQDKKVPREMLEKLIEIACSAPSAKNAQPWHWIVVQEPEDVHTLAGLVIEWMRAAIEKDPQTAQALGFTRAVSSWDQGHERICRGAPHVIVAHAHKDWLFGPEDCALALSHLDLYATAVGLGTCWAGYLYRAINAYPPLAEALALPEDHRAFGAMMVGYPKYKYQRIPIRNRPRVRWK